jgi:quinol monooxygenase YgiN
MNYDDAESQDILKRMLLKRKRIIHKAANKKDAFKEIIEKRLQEHGNLKYSLVYVPEGMKPQGKKADIYEIEEDVYDNRETLDIDEENKHLIDEYTAIVRDADPHVIVRQFTSESGGREDMLKGYAAGEIDVLTSMKCLDEGVDVPRSEFAVFCSSTGNPRQFIQRRGRVLRLHPDKRFAVIHDLIVVPDYFSEETFTLEKNLVLGELKRVKEFALLSKNFHESVQVLDPYLKKYELSIFNN